jgi:TPR repeat protein
MENAEMAVMGGSALGESVMDTLYEDDDGVAKNLVYAVLWFRRVAADGNSYASWQLARFHIPAPPQCLPAKAQAGAVQMAIFFLIMPVPPVRPMAAMATTATSPRMASRSIPIPARLWPERARLYRH